MAVLDKIWFSDNRSYGYLDVHKTLVKGDFHFDICGCGRDLTLNVRKSFKDSDKYEFEVEHGRHTRRYVGDEPQEMRILEMMEKVCTYARCTFARRNRW